MVTMSDFPTTFGSFSAREPAQPIETIWADLFDGLLAQRVSLHKEEWLVAHNSDASVPLVEPPCSVRHLCSSWPMYRITGADELIVRYGMGRLLTTATRYQARCTGASPLAPSLAGVDVILYQSAEPLRSSLVVLRACALWFVGFFASLRSRGRHHISRARITDYTDLDTLGTAARLVTTGFCLRLVGRSLAETAATETLCGLVSLAVDDEPLIPIVIDSLMEIRLVDLVRCASVSRWQFDAYRSGMGPGQSE